MIDIAEHLDILTLTRQRLFTRVQEEKMRNKISSSLVFVRWEWVKRSQKWIRRELNTQSWTVTAPINDCLSPASSRLRVPIIRRHAPTRVRSEPTHYRRRLCKIDAEWNERAERKTTAVVLTCNGDASRRISVVPDVFIACRTTVQSQHHRSPLFQVKRRSE